MVIQQLFWIKKIISKNVKPSGLVILIQQLFE